MKKLLLLLTMIACFAGMTSCNAKQEMAAPVTFAVKSDCSDANLTKIENLIRSKGFEIGTVKVTAEGDLNDLEIYVKQITLSFLAKVTKEEINNLNTGATYVEYSSKCDAFQTPTVVVHKEL